jgi:hypothetical protein
MHTGHFYFAKNRTFLLCVDMAEGFSCNIFLPMVINEGENYLKGTLIQE